MFLSAVVAGAWLASVIFGMQSPAPAAATASTQPGDPSAPIDAADAARRRGDLDDADRLYRLAWSDPQTRQRAAGALRGLEHAGRTPPIDEHAVANTARLLGAGFSRATSDHFVLLSDAPRGAVRAKLRILERTYDQYFRVMGHLGFAVIPPESKLICVLFADHTMYHAFARTHDNVDAGWVAGYYAGLSNRAVFYEDSSGPAFSAAQHELDRARVQLVSLRDAATRARHERHRRDARALSAQADLLSTHLANERSRLRDLADGTTISKTIHEAVHLLAFNTGAQSRAREYPFWLTEGLATSFETRNASAAFGPDRPSDLRREDLARAFAAGATLPIADLVARAGAPDDNPAMTEVAYAQAHSLFVFLHRTDRRALAGFFDDLLAEPPGHETDARRLELFERRFGAAARVEHRWRRDAQRTLGVIAATNAPR